MRFISLVSDQASSSLAVEQLIEQARQFTGGKVDVVFAFLTAHHRDDAETVVEKLWLELDPQAVVGCTAEGVIGADREIERSPGIALLVGDMPGMRLHPFHVATRDWKPLLENRAALAERFGHGPQTRAVIAFGDPFTTPIAQLLSVMDEAMPDSPLIGGMASAASSPGGNALLKNDQVFVDGLVGLSLSGAARVQTVVSQGCRPIGPAMVITKAQTNLIEELGGQPALRVLGQIVADLPPDDKQLIRAKGVMIGRAISEYQDHFDRGDFLIRHITAVNDNSDSISVGDFVRPGQTIRFHVHDAATAHEDLEYMLSPSRLGPPPPAALLFSCNGRGSRLFSEPGHDIALARRAMPNAAIAGFFAAGEIGPVGGKNFLHGHTASFALLRPGD
jgi:small ligand-binding sensory domain FIST